MDLQATEFRRLLSRAQRGQAAQVLAEVAALLEAPAADLSAEVRVQLLLVRALAEFAIGQEDLAIAAATEASAVAESARSSGFSTTAGSRADWVGWQAGALAVRAWVTRSKAHRTSSMDDLIEAEVLLRRAARQEVAATGHRMIGLTYTHLGLYELAVPHLETVVSQQDHQSPDDETHLVDLLNLASVHWSWACGLEQLEPLPSSDRPSTSSDRPNTTNEELMARLRDAQRWFAVAQLNSAPDSLWWSSVSGAVADVACWMDPAQLDRLPSAATGESLNQSDVLINLGRIRALRRTGRVTEALTLAERTIGHSYDTVLADPIRGALQYQAQLARQAAGVAGSVEAGQFLHESLVDLWEQRAYALDGVRARRSAALAEEQFRHTARLAERDPLTGLGNRRALMNWLADRPYGPVSMALVDLDGFKAINDRFGHDLGDRVLARVARLLDDLTEPPRLAVRLGGDEFLVLAPDGDLAGLVRQISDAFATLDIADVIQGVTLRASVGGAKADAGEPTAGLIDAADRSMFGIKHGTAPAMRGVPAQRSKPEVIGRHPAEPADDPWRVTPDLDAQLNRIMGGESREVAAELRAELDKGGLAAGRGTQLGHLLIWSLTVSRDYDAVTEECTRQLERVRAWGAPGWRSVALGMQAHNLVELGDRARALQHLMAAESGLAGAPDTAGTLGAHRTIGNAYLELGLYELALPHYEAAVAGGKQPLSTQGRLADLYNLCNVHTRWAEELHRVTDNGDGPTPAERSEIDAHVDEALLWAGRLAARTAGDHNSYLPFIELSQAVLVGLRTPGAGLAQLDELLAGLGSAAFNLRAVALTAKSAQLLNIGRAAEALADAERAIGCFDGQSESRVSVIEAQYQRHLALAALKTPGSLAAQLFVRDCVRRLWDQRLDLVEAVRAQRDLRVMQAQEEQLSQLAKTDPLTGLGNRRAFDDWCRLHPVGPASLFLIDIDGFKRVNDEHGHEVGDQVLLRAAALIKQGLPAHAEAVRFGGDEFVVLLAGENSGNETYPLPSIILTGVLPGLTVTTTVGRATVAPGRRTSGLIHAADQDLLTRKDGTRTAGGVR